MVKFPRIATDIRFFLFLVILHCSLGELIYYNNHILYPEEPQYIIIPKFAKNEVPHWSPGNGRSFIDVAGLNVYSSCGSKLLPAEFSEEDCKHSDVEMLMFSYTEEKLLWDYWVDGDYCCSQELFDMGR